VLFSILGRLYSIITVYRYGSQGAIAVCTLLVFARSLCSKPCIADVGGGSVENTNPRNLARIPLRWMIRECFKTNTGIMFDSQKIRDLGIDPATLWPEVLPRPSAEQQLEQARNASIHDVPRTPSWLSRLFGRRPENSPHRDQRDPSLTEEQHDLDDALQPIYDRLSLNRVWWILEILPIRQTWQDDEDDSRVSRPKFNLGKGRYIPQMTMPGVGVKVHRSVKIRMEARYHHTNKQYVPRANLKEEFVTWVD
jgi:hypothetical protein